MKEKKSMKQSTGSLKENKTDKPLYKLIKT